MIEELITVAMAFFNEEEWPLVTGLTDLSRWLERLMSAGASSIFSGNRGIQTPAREAGKGRSTVFFQIGELLDVRGE